MTGTDAPTRRGFLASLSAATALGVATHTLGAQPTRQAGDPATRARRGLAGGDDFLLEPGLVYLQTGSLGPTPRPVMDRTIAAWRELERNPTFYAYGAHEQQLDVVRQQAATFLGCATDELVLTTCTSEGLNRVAQGLQLAAGDRVVGAAQRRIGPRGAQHVDRQVGQQVGAGGRADLVGDHLELLALLGQPQHGLGEVAAVWAVQPCGPNNV